MPVDEIHVCTNMTLRQVLCVPFIHSSAVVHDLQTCSTLGNRTTPWSSSAEEWRRSSGM